MPLKKMGIEKINIGRMPDERDCFYMNILVCGGAGYIGSHMVKMLHEKGHQITIFDNLSTGHKEALKWGNFYEGDLLNIDQLEDLFHSNNFDAVMHFSAKSLVGESMTNPEKYYLNNVVGTLNLLGQMKAFKVNKFVFSSSAATYGNPVKNLIDEAHPLEPINPYGRSKLMVEKILSDYAESYGLCSVSLRYFNAAGADSDSSIGESHTPETHLIPNILKSLTDSTNTLKVFGNDYETKDGTCVRDYIHVTDLCRAHLLAVEYMSLHKKSHVFNLGNGKGFSILEVIKAAENVTGNTIKFEYDKRREGDPPMLVADSSLAQKELGWEIEYSEIEKIIETAWNWHRKQPY